MDIEIKTEFKNELYEGINDIVMCGHHVEQVSNLEENQSEKVKSLSSISEEIKICNSFIKVKSEIEIKEELLHTEEDGAAKDKLEQISQSQENQNLFDDVCKGGNGTKAKKTSGSRLQRSVKQKETVNKNYLGNINSEFCNFKSNEFKNQLKSHKRKFTCVHCNYETNFKSRLKDHSLIHSNIKLFKCSECSYEFGRKASLNRHMFTHKKFKLFKCSERSYECKQKRYLLRHMLMHGNIKFKCSECDYESNHKANLRLHILSHGSVKLFKCPECNYESNHKGNLRKHIHTHANK